MSEKVLTLPVSSLRREKSYANPQQIELFGERKRSIPIWVLLNPDDFVQDIFLKLIVRNQFDLVLDLRPDPVFRKPNYDHKYLMNYFYKKSIGYFDLATIAQADSENSFNFFSELRIKFKAGNRENNSFYTLCLANDDPLTIEVVRQFRKVLRDLGDHVVEVHPRAVLT